MLEKKRELKRQYLEAPSRAGVLANRHLASGRVLVEGSANARAALNRHAFELRMRLHRNRDLQRDWDAAGEAGFAFEVLDLVVPREEPGFDAKRELEALVALWREELGVAGAAYAPPAPRPGA
jgi:hypothetical protein